MSWRKNMYCAAVASAAEAASKIIHAHRPHRFILLSSGLQVEHSPERGIPLWLPPLKAISIHARSKGSGFTPPLQDNSEASQERLEQVTRGSKGTGGFFGINRAARPMPGALTPEANRSSRERRESSSGAGRQKEMNRCWHIQIAVPSDLDMPATQRYPTRAGSGLSAGLGMPISFRIRSVVKRADSSAIGIPVPGWVLLPTK